ncbi:hypothetical protein KP509_04G020500 [Ceratopteris richardii]|uniref:WD repeat-containing protein 91 homolog n=1 Tax=Ceratopteris richardii TaxID=49495 RepID=A0A8T2UQR3_CERRI|nr:hypothetical protein KP509_04G020500 [Ceratopteris richardii]
MVKQQDGMSNIQYAEELIREFLLFRGFTKTLQNFEADLSSDHAQAFQADQILALIFSLYIPRFEVEKMQSLLLFIQKCFFSSSDAHRLLTLRKFETSLKQYYIVYAIQKGRIDRVVDFFQRYGQELLHSGDDWHAWFALPYIKNPQLDSRFQLYFSKDWLDMLLLSFGNFLNEVFNSIRKPTLVTVSEKILREKDLKHKINELVAEKQQLHNLLVKKDQEFSELQWKLLRCSEKLELKNDCSATTSDCKNSCELHVERTIDKLEVNNSVYCQDGQPRTEESSNLASGEVKHSSHSIAMQSRISEGILSDGVEITIEDKLLQISVESQETFSGHTSAISRCRFSAGGGNIASASVDGTVRIWSAGPDSSTSRNATIYCGAEVLSIEWDSKSDRLLLIGTAERGIKAWNVDAKRVVCDFTTDVTYPRILDLKCSPVEPIFASAAASLSHEGSVLESKGFASLTLWNLKTWKPLTALSLGEDPPTITSICFNHNGRMLAAGATDGLIYIFDIYGRLPITGWPAHDSAVSCVKFGPDQASIFSLGADGKIFEWSLHNQGRILQEHDASMFCHVSEINVPRHEMALDAQGNMLLLTSNSSSSPIYNLQQQQQTKLTLHHRAPITSVDWHPIESKYITGSADHSVRITCIGS